MKRLAIFFSILFFSYHLIDQEYKYDDGGEGLLYIQCIIGQEKYISEVSTAAPFPRMTAIWNIAKQAAAE